MRQKGEINSPYQFTPSTLAGVLAITTLNRYSATLTASAIGISQQRRDNIRNELESGGLTRGNAVTLGTDGRVFLADNAFYQAGTITQMFRSNTDLPGVIVHEFFHRAGLNENQVRALNPSIQRNCGTPGDGL